MTAISCRCCCSSCSPPLSDPSSISMIFCPLYLLYSKCFSGAAANFPFAIRLFLLCLPFLHSRTNSAEDWTPIFSVDAMNTRRSPKGEYSRLMRQHICDGCPLMLIRFLFRFDRYIVDRRLIAFDNSPFLLRSNSLNQNWIFCCVEQTTDVLISTVQYQRAFSNPKSKIKGFTYGLRKIYVSHLHLFLFLSNDDVFYDTQFMLTKLKLPLGRRNPTKLRQWNLPL